jgi:hypothetical protein
MTGNTPDVRIVLIKRSGIQDIIPLVIIHMMALKAVIEDDMLFMGKPHPFSFTVAAVLFPGARPLKEKNDDACNQEPANH